MNFWQISNPCCLSWLANIFRLWKEEKQGMSLDRKLSLDGKLSSDEKLTLDEKLTSDDKLTSEYKLTSDENLSSNGNLSSNENLSHSTPVHDPSSDWASIHERNQMFSSVSLSSTLIQSLDVDSNFMPVSAIESPIKNDTENNQNLSPLCKELIDLIPDLSFMLK